MIFSIICIWGEYKRTMDIRANYGKTEAMGTIYTRVFNSAHIEGNRRVLLYEITWIFFRWGK